jgi:hypothetical protein
VRLLTGAPDKVRNYYRWGQIVPDTAQPDPGGFTRKQPSQP